MIKIIAVIWATFRFVQFLRKKSKAITGSVDEYIEETICNLKSIKRGYNDSYLSDSLKSNLTKLIFLVFIILDILVLIALVK